MGRRVFEGLAFVVGRRQDLSILGDYGADGYLSLLGSQRGRFEGAAHKAQIPLCFGPRIRRPGLLGFVVRFRFLWHGADNSNAARYDQGGGRTDKFFIIGGLCNAARSRVWRRFGRSMSVCEALLGARSWVRTGWWTSVPNLLFAGGHVLLTDIPGVDKTTLVRAISSSILADLSRIRSASDLLPSDITGTSTTRERHALTDSPARSSRRSC